MHLLGLVSDGGIHSHINHLFAILELCYELEFNNVFVHVVLDGRDTLPKSGKSYLEKLILKLESFLKKLVLIFLKKFLLNSVPFFVSKILFS